MARYVELNQGTGEWLVWRTGGIGASDASIIMGDSPYFTRDKLLKRKVDELRTYRKGMHSAYVPKNDTPDNGAMARGRRLEPEARRLYERLTGRRMPPVCVIHESLDWMRASLDGINEANDLILEIKCPNKLDHEMALAGEVPVKYFAQVQHQLYVVEAPLLHYWSYTDNPRFSPADRVALVAVRPDTDYLPALVARELEFWEEAKRLSSEPAWMNEQPAATENQ